mgnify:FL=1
MSQTNFQFIAHARTDVPALLDYIAALRRLSPSADLIAAAKAIMMQNQPCLSSINTTAVHNQLIQALDCAVRNAERDNSPGLADAPNLKSSAT